jgi:anthranilate/para-aminobenzoate synthase component II
VLVDNYDSFTYNLSQYMGDLGCEHVVLKNDEKTVEEIRAMDPRGILVSPGPGEHPAPVAVGSGSTDEPCVSIGCMAVLAA